MIYKNKEGDVFKVQFSKRKGKFIIPDKILDYDCYEIGSEDFIDWYELTEIIIPEGILNIKNFAFSLCQNLTKVQFPKSLTNIGDWTFYNCEKLTNIIIPENLISIGKEAFSLCKSLSNITIPESVTKIGHHAFYDDNNLEIVINNSKNNIQFEESAFDGCKSVKWLKD